MAKKQQAKNVQAIHEKQKAIDDKRKAKRERLGRPPVFLSSKALACSLAQYFYKCDNTIIDAEKGKTEPYTLTGIQLALGMDNKTYQRYKTGDQDARLVDIVRDTGNGLIEDVSQLPDNEKVLLCDVEHDPDVMQYVNRIYDNRTLEGIYYSTIIKKARQLVQQQAELRLYIRGSVADIFTLKSQYGWQEQNTTVHRVEIATSEDARAALEDLKMIDG